MHKRNSVLRSAVILFGLAACGTADTPVHPETDSISIGLLEPSCPEGANLTAWRTDQEVPLPDSIPADTVFHVKFRIINTGTVFCESSISAIGDDSIFPNGSPSVTPDVVELDGYSDYIDVIGEYKAGDWGFGRPGVQITKGGSYIYEDSVQIGGCELGDISTFDPAPGTGYTSTHMMVYWQWGLANTGRSPCTTRIFASATDSLFVPTPPGIWSSDTILEVSPGDTLLIWGEYKTKGPGTGLIKFHAIFGDQVVQKPVVSCGSFPCS